MLLLMGDEEFLLEEEARSRTTGVVEKLAPIDLTPARMGDLTAFSLFAEDRTLIITNADKLLKLVYEQLGSIEEASVVLLHPAKPSNASKFLAPLAEVLEVRSYPKTRDRVGFLVQRAKRAGRALTPQAAEVLAEVATDLREVAAILDQMCSDTVGTITDEVVLSVRRANPQATGFAVADAALDSGPAQAVTVLRTALNSGTNPVLVATALILGLREVSLVAGHGSSDPSVLARDLKLPPWKVKKAQARARRFQPVNLARALELALVLDPQVKGGAPDAPWALTSAVGRIASLHA